MRAVFLDKDGTLLRDVPYNADPGLMELAPGAEEGLGLFAEAGFALVVVSNQSGVARGLIPFDSLREIERRLRELVRDAGAELLDVQFCPHHPNGTVESFAVPCACRKPAPGMILRAAARHHLELKGSWMVGDILDDVEAGNRAGCRSVLLCNGGETVWRPSEERIPTAVAADLATAARIVTRAEERVG